MDDALKDDHQELLRQQSTLARFGELAFGWPVLQLPAVTLARLHELLPWNWKPLVQIQRAA